MANEGLAARLADVKLPECIAEFYADKNVFITGVSGFVGKVLLEKLLRSCPDIKHVYVLLREKNMCTYKQRLDRILLKPVFARLQRDIPNLLLKVIPVCGDVTREGLELGEDHKNLLKEVNIIFNCAASVRFDEKSKTALMVNLLGTKNVLALAQSLQYLEVLVHVSTAYSFCGFDKIHEKIYPEIVDPDNIISLLNWMDEGEIDEVCKLVNKRPYVYHFSKALAEIYLENNRRSLRIAIVRPSIITASWKEPFPGWTDTYYGPSGLILACGKGLVRSLHVRPSFTADFVPVDVVANALIISSYYTVMQRYKMRGSSRDSGLFVLNCTTPVMNSLTWGDVERIVYPLLLKYPSMDIYRHPGGNFKESYWRHQFSVISDHYLPALLSDAMTLPCQRESIYLCYHRVHRMMSHLEYFTTHQFTFYTQNMKRLEGQMTEMDKAEFPINMDKLNWPEYMNDYVLGLRRYLMHEEDSTLPHARQRMNRTYWLWMAIQATCVLTTSAFASMYLETRVGEVLRYQLGYLGKVMRDRMQKLFQ